MEARSCDFSALSQVWYVSYTFLAMENNFCVSASIAVVAYCTMDELAPGLRGESYFHLLLDSLSGPRSGPDDQKWWW